jgi:hypothetical protein
VLQPTFSAASFTHDAHRHFERTGGDVAPELLHEFGHGQQPERERPISPKVQQLLDSARQLQEERIKRARTEERLDLITEALREEKAAKLYRVPAAKLIAVFRGQASGGS